MSDQRATASAMTGDWRARGASLLDAILQWTALYALPIVIALVTAAAVLLWDAKYSAAGAVALQMRTVEQTADALVPEQARARLSTEALTLERDTSLSERPFWLRVEVRPLGDEAVTLDLPSRHATEVACWNAGNLQPLGAATRLASSGVVRSAKSGFALELGRLRASVPVLCKASFIGPARISAAQWHSAQFEASAHDFHRRSGLLDGGLIVLAVFVLMTAIINREPVYVLFAAWLIFNLRMGAISSGWDFQWLGQTVPPHWLPQSRLLTVAAFFTLTGMLFRQMFRDDLMRFGYAGAMRGVHALGLLLLPVALLVPYAKALPLMWLVSTGGIAVLMVFLVRILVRTRSPVAGWYGAALTITLVASLYEVIAAALGAKGLIGAVNSVTAALSSSLMAAFAIAEQIRLERRQRLQAEAELRVTYDVVPVGLFTLDLRGAFVSANPALRQMLGIGEGPLREARWGSYFEDGAWPRLQEFAARSGAHEMEVDSAAPLAGSEGKRFLVKAVPAQDRIEGSLQDITEKSKAVARLHYLAENDSLTGVHNRRGVERLLTEALAQMPAGQPLAVAYLDLDRFKLVNDLYGHAAGDEVLRQVCARVREMLTAGQALGRIGGDEFVLVLAGTPIRPAAWTCRGILDRLAEQPYQVGDKAFQVRGSIGLVEVEAGAAVGDVIAAADEGCREAKRGHQDGLVVYEKSAAVFHERERDLQLVARLSHPDGPQGLFLEMQPLLAVRTPFETLNFEVLLRMRDADGSLIPADRLIPLAEDKGLIGIIDRWVLSSVLAWLNTHGDKLKHTRFVCMNLSGASLNDEHFVNDAFALLERYPRAAQRLCLEITESVALHDLDNMRRFIDAARGLGCKVALDDFGAGYTSFSYLKDLPADVLKIDGSFIRAVNEHPANLAIVEAIVHLARSLGMRTIAEWAEDRETVESLVDVGIDFIQGYVVARPQSPELILAATSSGSFIQDEALRQYVRSLTAEAPVPVVWEGGVPPKPTDLH